jgi:hypothetical protein
MPRRTQSTQEPAQNAREAEAAPATSEAPAALPSASGTPAEEQPAPPAPPSLAGLRGEDYVKALDGQPSLTLQVPLLPNERRGDWERAKGQKIAVTTRQMSVQPGTTSHAWLERDHALAALIIEHQRPGATRFDQIDLNGSPARSAIEHLNDYMNQARLRAQVQTGKKWNAAHIYLVPAEDA